MPARLKAPHKVTHRLNRDFIAPEGVEVVVEPTGTRKTIAVPYASVMVAVTRDVTAELWLPLSEAIRCGLVREEP